MPAERDSGGSPQTIGRCTECGKVYSARRRPDGDLYPVGNDGSCLCGSVEFQPVGY